MAAMAVRLMLVDTKCILFSSRDRSISERSEYEGNREVEDDRKLLS